MYYERLMSLAGLEKRAYPQNGYGVNGQQNPSGAPVVQDYSLTDALYPGRRAMQSAAQNTQNSNLTGQSSAGVATKPWNHNNWNESRAGRTSYNIANSTAGAVKSFGNGVANAWDKTKYHVGDTLDRAYKGFAEVWNPMARSVEDAVTGAYHGVTGVFGDPNADRFAQNSRVMQQIQQQDQQRQQQREKEMEESRQQGQKNYEYVQARRQQMEAQKQQDAANLEAKKQQFAQQRQADNDAWRQRMDKWNKKFNNVTQGVKPYVDHLNSRPQTPKPASTPAQPSAAVQQIQNNINSTQNPSLQTTVTPAAGAPTVQQPTTTPAPSTSQTSKTVTNTNWQDPGYWNNSRPTGRQGY